VHACACRDIDGSLVVGNLNQTKLKDILSFENVPYRELIESQMQGSSTKTVGHARPIGASMMEEHPLATLVWQS
jgi:hypothetical protein